MRNRIAIGGALFATLAVYGLPARLSGDTFYVTPMGGGTFDGSSWANAFFGLHNALVNHTFPAGSEIWVKQGTYKIRPSATVQSFVLPNSVRLRGGFVGTETDYHQRVPNHPSILSGEVGNQYDYSDNTEVVVSGSGLNGDTVFDRFTIERSKKHGLLLSDLSQPQCIDLLIRDNYCLDDNTLGAGALVMGGANAKFTTCSFQNNTIVAGPLHGNFGGGGLAVDNAIATLTGCEFHKNSSNHGGDGAGVRLRNAFGFFQQCTFTDNTVYDFRGGGAATSESSSVFWGCTFERNVSIATANADTDAQGGGLWADSTQVISCTFDSNSTLDGDYAPAGRGGSFFVGKDVRITNTILSNSLSGKGGGLYFDDVDITWLNLTAFGNTASADGGGAYINLDEGQPPGPSLTNCIFWKNLDSQGETDLSQIWEPAPDMYFPDGQLSVTYCDIDGMGTHSYYYNPHLGNIDADPAFVDSNDGDFVLTAGSPCIDAGTPQNMPTDPYDINNNSNTDEKTPDRALDNRVLDDPLTHDTGVSLNDAGNNNCGTPDMGAFEYKLANVCHH